MRIETRRRWTAIIRFILFGLAAIALGGFLLAWSGLYNVAASRGHLAVTNAMLTFGMRSSVRTHALGITAPPLDSQDLSTLGAAHFHSGCAFCHGAPGVPISPIAESMLPSPPNLSTSMREWRDRELFWIVKNGLKYTGMPAWAAQQRDDEVWALVAFLRRLPALDAAAYRELALGGLSVPAQSGDEIATTEGTSGAVSACARCHGENRRGPNSRLVPVLHGQPREFLMAALEDYAHGRRASGIMQPLASDLSPEDRERVARYYAGLTPPAAPDLPPLNPESVERGRKLATSGDPAARIPGCMGCHNASSLEAYPRLAGQHAVYMVNRLRLWKGGLASRSRTDAIMAPIAKALNEQQIDDVSAYFSSLNAAGKLNR
ncbi:c-type cytochrome [Bradyrhizobium sp.]|uniref:c-type cytochrome n=1 Tax=Bradyrhizobium sp. TaxID=376 RepID=UPI000AC8B0D5|nr:c-type cytochrome [Bradyrhizobium sp.]